MQELTTNRGLWKFILLSIVTLGIYGIVVFTKMTKEVNLVASPHDHRHTMHYCLLFFLIGPITFGIGYLVWWTKFCGRIGNELARRQSPVHIGGGTYWGWRIFGALLFGVGIFIFYYKLFKASNALNAYYNAEHAQAAAPAPEA